MPPPSGVGPDVAAPAGDAAVGAWPPTTLPPVGDGPDVWAVLDEALDPGALRPRLADHVELKAFQLRWGNDYAIVANRRDLLYYRLEPAEAQLVEQLDGTRTVAELFGDELGAFAGLTFEGFADLTKQLHAGRFFTTGGGDVDEMLAARLQRGTTLSRALHRLVRSQPIEWRGAERPVTWLYRNLLRPAFHPVGAIALSMVAVAGLVAFLALSQRGDVELVGDTPALQGLVLLLMSYVLTICHEIGHAVVLVHYGRRVKSAGFTIYFGSPAMFIDSTDGLLLDQRQRILQSFGGPFAELVIAGAASIIALALPDTTVGDTMFRFAVLNYFVLFLNLIPLLELDGYWIFSDLIQVPDLRPRSLQFVRHELWARIRHRTRLTRQEVGLALYGTLGVAFTILSIYGAVFFWRALLGTLVSDLWRGGTLTRSVLLVLLVVVAGPVLRALIDAGRSLVRLVRERARRARFRLETSWRIEAATLLDESALFSDLPVEVLNDLAGRVQRRSIAPGQAVIRQGDRAESLFVVRSGRVEVTERDARSGVERSLRLLGRGQVFGEVGLAAGGHRSATVRAVAASEVFELPKGAFDHLLRDELLPSTFDLGFHDLEELRQIGPFAALPAVDLAKVLHGGRWIDAAPGDVLIQEGDQADAFYGLRSGRVEVVAGADVRAVLGPGDSFGERGLLAGAPRAATVRAVSPVRAFRLGREAFDAILREAFRSGPLGARRPELDSREH